MIKYKLKSYDYLIHSSYERIVSGKLFDEKLNPPFNNACFALP